jgi:hypothetical protein
MATLRLLTAMQPTAIEPIGSTIADHSGRALDNALAR